MKKTALFYALTAAGAPQIGDLFFLKASMDISKDAPWQKIGVTGKWDGHLNGTFEMNQITFDQMVSNYERGGIDIVVDYEHQTLWGGEAPASGWILKEPISLKVENGELFAQIQWTDRAKAMIMSGEYRYMSPVFAPNTISQSDGSNIGWTLHSVALTNKPFLEELDEVRLNKLIQNTNHTKEEGTMTKEEELAIIAENEKIKAENEALKTQNEQHAEAQAEAKVEAAIAAKKLHPDQKESALKMCKADPAGFDTFMSAAKPMIQKPGDDLFENKHNGKKDDGELSPEELKAAVGGAN